MVENTLMRHIMPGVSLYRQLSGKYKRLSLQFPLWKPEFGVWNFPGGIQYLILNLQLPWK